MPAPDPPTEILGPPRKPAMLGKYELRKPVGSGSSGTVFDAWDPDLARRVAIKQVRLEGRTDAEQRELRARFRQEAQMAGRLSHPGVVGVYDYGEQDGVAYLVMEFVQGETLAAMLRGMRERQEALSPGRAVAIVREMLGALAACHSAGVLHRDIKPGNVMVSADGSVKLTDFGIARTETSELTAHGTLLGTPTYMSPEQFDARGSLDSRCDLYSCGVVLYELLTGRRPFEGELFAVMHQVRTDQPVPPSRIVRTVPPALEAAVLRAMAKRPADRFQDAKAFAAALQCSLGGGVSSRKVGRAFAAGMLGLAVLGGLAWEFVRPPIDTGSSQPIGIAASSPAAAPKSAPSDVPREVPSIEAPSVPAVWGIRDEDRLLAGIGKLPCAVIDATLQRDPPRLGLRGIVGETTARGALPDLLTGYPGNVSRQGLQEIPVSGATCLVADLVRGVPPGTLHLELAGGRTRLIAGQTIAATLRMPDFAGEVRLDYVTDGGRTVVHLDPGKGGVRRWNAGDRVPLGPAGDGVIGTVGEPFGADLVLVTVSAQALSVSSRSGEEPAEGYLQALQAAVGDAVRRGVRVEADAAMLETAGR